MHMPRLPGPISMLVTLLACLLLPLALVSSWLATTVSDTDAYVETVTPLASDPEVLSAVRSELHTVAVRAMARTPAAGQETNRVDAAIERVTADERFSKVWAEGNRQVHEQVISVLDDDNSRVDTSSGVVSVDLSGLVGTLVDRLDASGVRTPADVRNVDATIALMKTSDLEQLRSGYQLLDTLGFWLPVIWVLLVVLLLLTARRRLAAVGHLAVGSLVTLALLAILLAVARGLVTDRSPDPGLARAVWDVVLDPLWNGLWALVVAAVVVLVVRIVLGVVLRTRTAR